jgi:hypothetical protein
MLLVVHIIFDKISNKFQFRLKDRATAGNILGEAQGYNK